VEIRVRLHRHDHVAGSLKVGNALWELDVEEPGGADVDGVDAGWRRSGAESRSSSVAAPASTWPLGSPSLLTS
jgi:hypothetical protein